MSWVKSIPGYSAPNAHPRFFKARLVPFAIKAAINEELDQLEASGIISKVTHSEWAAPIVSVPKRNGRFRICDDYKVTINQALDVDQYPLPKPEDLFATLAGGNKFTKLDVSQAYQQLTLDEESGHDKHPSRILSLQPTAIWCALSPSSLSEINGHSATRNPTCNLLHR